METRTLSVKTMANADEGKADSSSSVKKCCLHLASCTFGKGWLQWKSSCCPLPKQQRLEVWQAVETIPAVSVGIGSSIEAFVKRGATDPSLRGAPCLRHQPGSLTRASAGSRI